MVNERALVRSKMLIQHTFSNSAAECCVSGKIMSHFYVLPKYGIWFPFLAVGWQHFRKWFRCVGSGVVCRDEKLIFICEMLQFRWRALERMWNHCLQHKQQFQFTYTALNRHTQRIPMKAKLFFFGFLSICGHSCVWASLGHNKNLINKMKMNSTMYHQSIENKAN